MSIPDHVRNNFTTLLRAAHDDRLALVECAETATGEFRHVVCAVNVEEGVCQLVPFGHLCEENPFDLYTPPMQDAAHADG